MTPNEVRALIRDVLAELAPEADTAGLADNEDMREALDLDSIDFSNLLIAVHERTAIEIPEADSHHLFSMAGAIAYMADKGPLRNK